MMVLAVLVIVAGMAFQIAGAVLVRRLRAPPRPMLAQRPPLTLLKPLCGAEPDLAEDLATFWRPDWPGLRMVCGVADPSDPAAEAVRRLQARMPDADIRLVTGGPARATNAKVANLCNMLEQAQDGILIIADSDMRAPPDYLEAVVAALAAPGVGLATCLYVGRPESGVWSRLGAMGINHGFLPAALVGRALGRADGCFGATMALTRATLERAGGLAVCADVLADDYRLGQAVRALGLSIALVPLTVSTRVVEPGLATLATHELRWSRTVASVAPLSFLSSVLAQPALSWLAALWAWPLLPLAVAVRWAAVRLQERALALTPAPLWLIVLRDGLSLAVFVAALCGRSVQWRGRHYRIRRDGSLVSCPRNPQSGFRG
ncbi:MAG: bacteriohopanetetrol glucosamine biosynthesis glycosyltransferase HpnI [Bacteroidota bacterium]